MITIITDKQLPAAEVGLWIKAQQAVEAKNYKYAVSILRTLAQVVHPYGRAAYHHASRSGDHLDNH